MGTWKWSKFLLNMVIFSHTIFVQNLSTFTRKPKLCIPRTKFITDIINESLYCFHGLIPSWRVSFIVKIACIEIGKGADWGLNQPVPLRGLRAIFWVWLFWGKILYNSFKARQKNNQCHCTVALASSAPLEIGKIYTPNLNICYDWYILPWIGWDVFWIHEKIWNCDFERAVKNWKFENLSLNTLHIYTL